MFSRRVGLSISTFQNARELEQELDKVVEMFVAPEEKLRAGNDTQDRGV